MFQCHPVSFLSRIKKSLVPEKHVFVNYVLKLFTPKRPKLVKYSINKAASEIFLSAWGINKRNQLKGNCSKFTVLGGLLLVSQ